jgi:hypothetical protein
MTHCYDMWPVIQRRLKSDQWTTLQELYRAVQGKCALDAEDWLPAAPGSSDARWRRNVRNVLQQRRAAAQVELKRPAMYRHSSQW